MQYNRTNPSANCKKFEIRHCNNNQAVFYPQKNKAAGQYPAAFNQYTLQRPLAARPHE